MGCKCLFVFSSTTVLFYISVGLFKVEKPYLWRYGFFFPQIKKIDSLYVLNCSSCNVMATQNIRNMARKPHRSNTNFVRDYKTA